MGSFFYIETEKFGHVKIGSNQSASEAFRSTAFTVADGEMRNLNLENITDLSYLFAESWFNEPIDWIIEVNHPKSQGKRIDANHMFYKAYSFNSPITINTKFNIPHNVDFGFGFERVNSMFESAISFNNPINIKTNFVIDMWKMFKNAKSFDQSIDFYYSSLLDRFDDFLLGADAFSKERSLQLIKNIYEQSSRYAFNGDFPRRLETFIPITREDIRNLWSYRAIFSSDFGMYWFNRAITRYTYHIEWNNLQFDGNNYQLDHNSQYLISLNGTQYDLNEYFFSDLRHYLNSNFNEGLDQLNSKFEVTVNGDKLFKNIDLKHFDQNKIEANLLGSDYQVIFMSKIVDQPNWLLMCTENIDGQKKVVTSMAQNPQNNLPYHYFCALYEISEDVDSTVKLRHVSGSEKSNFTLTFSQIQDHEKN